MEKQYRNESGKSDFELNAVIHGLLGLADYLREKDHMTAIDMTEVVGGSTGYITQYHIPADEALHIWSAQVGKSDVFDIFDGDYVETIKSTGFLDVYDISDKKDHAELENRIDNL